MPLLDTFSCIGELTLTFIWWQQTVALFLVLLALITVVACGHRRDPGSLCCIFIYFFLKERFRKALQVLGELLVYMFLANCHKQNFAFSRIACMVCVLSLVYSVFLKCIKLTSRCVCDCHCCCVVSSPPPVLILDNL